MSLTKLSLTGKSLVGDIPARDGKIANLFYSVVFLFARVASNPFAEPDLNPVDLGLFCPLVMHVYLDSDLPALDPCIQKNNFS
jgi:hypothetical protein